METPQITNYAQLTKVLDPFYSFFKTDHEAFNQAIDSLNVRKKLSEIEHEFNFDHPDAENMLSLYLRILDQIRTRMTLSSLRTKKKK